MESEETASLASLEEGRPKHEPDNIDGQINLFFDAPAPRERRNSSATESGPEGPRTLLTRNNSRIINSTAPALQKQASLLRIKSDSDSTTATSTDQHVHFAPSSLEVEDKPSKKRKRWSNFSKYVTGTMPAWERKLNEMDNFWGAVLRFWDSFFRGIGQVGYINNSLAGVCVLIISLITDPWVGILGGIGCFCSTLFAGVAKLNTERFRSGLFGYNGYLLGANMAVTILTAWDWKSIIVTVVLSPLVIIFQVGCSNIFVTFDSPPFGVPLLIVIYLMYLCMYPSSFLRPWQRNPSLPNTRSVEYQLTAGLVFEGMGASISETFFTSNPWSAIPFLALLLLRSPWYFIAAVTGAVFGNLTLFLLGTNADNIRNGLWGWNAVLTGLALYGEFLEHNWRCWIYTAYATIAATIVQVGMIALFQVWGIPMSNISYTIVCIMFMTARKSIPGLQEKVGEQVPSDPTELRKKEFAKRRAVSRFMKV